MDAVDAALQRDRALRGELELILIALEPEARSAFGRELAALLAEAGSDRPAEVVLTALVRAARMRTNRAGRGAE